jgi:hypothetical protein
MGKESIMNKFSLFLVIILMVIACSLNGQVLQWQGYWAGGYVSGVPSDPWLILQPTSAYNFQIIDTGYNVVTSFSLPIPADAYAYSVIAASPDFDADANIEVLYEYMDATYYKYRAFLRDITTSSNQLTFSDNDTSYYAYTLYFGNERIIIFTGTYDSDTHTWLYRSNNPQNIDEFKKDAPIHNPFLNIYPNPGIKFAEIHYTVPEEGIVTVSIYDVTGSKLNTLINATLPKGEYMVPWYGTDSSHRILPAGTYYCIVTITEKQISEKLIMLR